MSEESVDNEKETVLVNGEVYELLPVSHESMETWLAYLKDAPLREFKERQKMQLGKDIEKEMFVQALEEVKDYTFSQADFTLLTIADEDENEETKLDDKLKKKRDMLNKSIKNVNNLLYLVFLRIRQNNPKFQFSSLTSIPFDDVLSIATKAFPTAWNDEDEKDFDIKKN